jgi:hypothetical protein
MHRGVQKRQYVTGRQAVQALAVDFELSQLNVDVIPVPADSPPLAMLRLQEQCVVWHRTILLP